MQFTFKNTANQNDYSNVYFAKTPRQNLNQIVKMNQSVSEDSPKVDENKMTWGEPIWFLFHTLAEKVKKESFPVIREELLQNIYTICSYLPCPSCANHATEYLNTINFNTIRSKDDFILMIFAFHNEVNSRKGFDAFDISELSKKYSAAVTINIIRNFMNTFEKRSKSNRMISTEYHKRNYIIRFKQWMNSNINHFDN